MVMSTDEGLYFNYIYDDFSGLVQIYPFFSVQRPYHIGMYISIQISKNSLYTYMSLLKGICMRIGGSQIAQLAASCAISLPFFLKHIPFNNDIILTDIGSSFHPEPIIFHFIFQRERSVCAVCSTICTFCSLMRYLRSPSFFQMTQIVSASYF